MTAHQMIDAADRVFVTFGLAAVPGDVEIRITKKEAHRLIRENGLPSEETGSVHLSGKTAVINYAT